jgi:riboflavin synthase
MFTGIVKKLSTVEKISLQKGSFFVDIQKPKGWVIKKGESISINGVCSTVKNLSEKAFQVEYMPETISKTTASSFEKGTEVNLEKSLRINDLLDGHIVQGHIDTTGKIIEIKKAKESKVMKIEVPEKFMKFIANKGSVSVDGISLTVVETGKKWFSVSLVSYTLENTNLGCIKVGEKVNIETDVLAKYLDKLIHPIE